MCQVSTLSLLLYLGQNGRFRGYDGNSPERLDQTAGTSSGAPAHTDGLPHHPAVLL